MVKDLLWLLSAMHYYPAHDALKKVIGFVLKNAEDAQAAPRVVGILKMSEFTSKTKRYIFQL